jgi:lipopolysaccharide/colanic/teichoic acid biosynthesis glycosyltransferase
LIGNMSMVGPRPEIPFYASRYAGDERLIFTVRPGITDACSLELADLDDRMDQRHGLTPGEFYERFILPRKKELQIQYAHDLSFGNDLGVLWRTFWRVLRRWTGR